MPYQIQGDAHTHTIFSRHAYSTIAENVVAAKEAGLTFLGSADHFGNMIYEDPSLINFQHFINVGIWPREWDGITVLRACEADITNLEGGLYGQDMACPANIVGRPFREQRSLFERVTDALDYVVASIHNGDFAREAPLVQTTEMYVGALENPRVFIIGHPGRSGIPFDLDEVLTCAKEHHKCIEINEHTFDTDPEGRFHDRCSKIAQRCAELGVGVVVSTDAHICVDVGHFEKSCAMLDEIHFPQELIVNRSLETFVGELAASGVCDLTALLGGSDDGLGRESLENEL